MKKIFSPYGLFILGFTILVVANAVVLLGVVSNRSVRSDTSIELTERELGLPYRVREEDSGLSLRMIWRSIGKGEDDIYSYRWGSPAWFDEQKIRELGFEVDDRKTAVEALEKRKEPVPKEVFIVLEYNGRAYSEAFKRAEDSREQTARESRHNSERLKVAEDRLKNERTSASRLFAIDAGKDAGLLRKKYSDVSRFIIVKGMVSFRYGHADRENEPAGYISGLSVENIHVPLKLRGVFDKIMGQDKSLNRELKTPRYMVNLAFGSRFEPWIQSVRLLTE